MLEPTGQRQDSEPWRLFLEEWAGDARELVMSLSTLDSHPLAELNGHSRDSDETALTIAAGSDFDATDANWIVVGRQSASASAECEGCGGEHDTDPSCCEFSSRFTFVSKVFRGNEKMQSRVKDDFPSLADAHRVQVQSKNHSPIGEQKEKLSTVLAIEPEGVHADSSGGWEEEKLALDSGATETVIPPHVLQGQELYEGVLFKKRRGM